jgi:hypothetical protein
MNLDDPESMPTTERKRDIDEAAESVWWLIVVLVGMIVVLLVPWD